jgi:hypothetical protein
MGDPASEIPARRPQRRKRVGRLILVAAVVVVGGLAAAATLYDEVLLCDIKGVNWFTDGFGPPCQGNGLNGYEYSGGGEYPYGSKVTETVSLLNLGNQTCYVSDAAVMFSAPPIHGITSNLPLTVPPLSVRMLSVSFPAPSAAYNWSIEIDYNATTAAP